MMQVERGGLSFALCTILLFPPLLNAENLSETKSKIGDRNMVENGSQTNKSDTKDHNGGVGAYLDYGDGEYFGIRGIKSGSPCEKAGIENGDQIAEIDGKSVKGLSYNEVSSLVRGPVGSKLRLKIISSDGSQKDVSVERIDISGSLGGYYSTSNYLVLHQLADCLDQRGDAAGSSDSAMSVGDFIGARASCSLALSRNAETYTPFGPTKNSNIAAAAKFYLSCGAFDQADALFKKLEENSAKVKANNSIEEPRCFNSIAECLERMGRTSEAESIYMNLLTAYMNAPKNSFYRKESVKEYCRFLIRQKRFTDVLPHLKTLETLIEGNSNWQELEFFGDAEYALGQFKQSAAWYERASTKYEANHQAQRQYDKDKPLIKLLFKAADAYYAGKDYQSALKANALALSKYKAAIPKDMEQTFEIKKEFHPAMSQLLVQEGDIHRAANKTEEAKQSYVKALQVGKAALGDHNAWLSEIESRLQAKEVTLAARKIDVSSVAKPTPWLKFEIPSSNAMETYQAFKSKSANRLDLANVFLNSMQSESEHTFSAYRHIAQFFSLIELENRNSEKNALTLLRQLQQKPAVLENIFPELILSVFEEWLSSKEQNSKVSFDRTCSILEKLAPDRQTHSSYVVPVFEKLRWLALEWRLAGYPELAKALLTKAEELGSRELASVNVNVNASDYEKKRYLTDSARKMKEDLCLVLIDLHLYSEAEALALDPALLNAQYNLRESRKGQQICDSLEAANQWKISEKILLALANLASADKHSDSSYAKSRVFFRLSKHYLDTEQFAKAEDFATTCIKTQSPENLNAFAVLAQALDKQNKLEPAMQNYLKAAAADLFGRESSESIDNKRNYLKRALAIQEKLYGKNAPRLIETLVLLTSALQRSGNTEEVQELTERISSLQKGRTSADRSSADSAERTKADRTNADRTDADRTNADRTNADRTNATNPEEDRKFWTQMVSNYRTSKEPEKEIEAQKKVARLSEQDEKNWGREYEHLAFLQLTQGHINESISDIKKYISSPAFPKQFREVGSVTGLGGVSDRFTDGLVKAGHTSEALAILRQAYNVAQSNYGKYDKSAITLSAAIAKAQAMSNDYQGCEETCKQTLKALEESRLNEPFPDRVQVGGKPIQSLVVVSSVLSEHKQDEKALSLLQQILDLQGKFLGKRSPEIAPTESAIASLLVKQNKFAEAKIHAWNTLEIYETNYGREWHAIGHYVSEYLNILRALHLENEIASVKKNYKEFDHSSYSSLRSSEIAFFRVEMENLNEGRTQLLKAAREEEKFSGANSKESRAILGKLIELESHAQNFELVLDLKKRLLDAICLIDSAEGVESRKQMKEIAELYQKLGQKEESARLIGKIVSILAQIPEFARSESDNFDLIHFYILQGEKAKATTLLTKLSLQYKAKNNDMNALRQCANYFAELGDSKESEILREMANSISKKQQEEYQLRMEKERAKRRGAP